MTHSLRRHTAIGLTCLLAAAATPWAAPSATAQNTADSTAATPSRQQAASDLTLTATDGTASVAVAPGVTPGETIRVLGNGWGPRALVVVKLNYARSVDGSVERGQYRRPADDALPHPGTGQPETSIWAVLTADDSGAVDGTVTLPSNLEPGQRLAYNFASGLRPGDTRHSVNTTPVTVGGVPWAGDDDAHIECTPSTPTTEWSVAKAPSADNTLRITGTGWCNSEGRGGARIAVKIDAGAVVRTNTDIHSNTTIWGIIDADTNGDFTYDLTLPNGTTEGPNGSTVPFADGVHTIQLLSGSLQAGDPGRSYPRRGNDDDREKASFTVGGVYRPNGTPAPIIVADTLSSANRRGVEVIASGTGENRTLTITVPGASVGDWVYPDFYNDCGTQRPLLATWYQLDRADQAQGTDAASVDIPITDLRADGGELTVAVYNGNQGAGGALLGWDTVYLSGEPGICSPTSGGAGGAGGAGGTGGQNNGTGGTGATTPGATTQKIDASPQIAELVTALAATAGTMTTLAGILDETGQQRFGAADADADAEANAELVEGDTVALADDAGAGVASESGGAESLLPVAAVPAAAIPATTTRAGSPVAAPVAASGSGVNFDTPAPEHTPAAPVASIDDLREENAGELGVALEDPILSLTVPEREPGEWVFLYAYAPKPISVGWVQLDEERTVTLDISALPAGNHKIAVVGAGDSDGEGAGEGAGAGAGELLGWVDLQLAAVDSELPVQAAGIAGTPQGGSDHGWLNWALPAGALSLLLLVAGALKLSSARRLPQY